MKKKNQNVLLIATGTWKDGLFEDNAFSSDEKEALNKNGEVTIQLFFTSKQLQIDLISVILKNNDRTIFQLKGEEAFISLQNAYKIHSH